MATETVSTVDGLIDTVSAFGHGDTVLVEDGHYEFPDQWVITSDGVTIEAASGKPHIDFNDFPQELTDASGVKIYGDDVTVRGLEISHSGWKGIWGARADNLLFEDLDVHHNYVWGIANNGGRNVTWRRCDSHHNLDDDGQDSDGFMMAGPVGDGDQTTDNLIEYCRAWMNGDDGYDMWNSEGQTLRYCWAWENGREETGNGNGFKLGNTNEPHGGGHTVEHCVAYWNRSSGFWWNGEAKNANTVRHCTAYENPINFAFQDIGHTVEDCVAYAGFTNSIGKVTDDYEIENPDCDGTVDPHCGVVISDSVTERYNSWNQGIADPQFVSLDPASDDFLRLSASSPCRGAASDGSDLGAIPYDGDGGTPGGGDRITVDGAVVLDAGDATLNGPLLQTEHPGYGGSGYINFSPDNPSTATWPLAVEAPGTYTAEIRYAHGGEAERPATLVHGDGRSEIAFPPTGGWDQWETKTVDVPLTEGSVDLSIEAPETDAGNVDQIALAPSSIRGGLTGKHVVAGAALGAILYELRRRRR